MLFGFLLTLGIWVLKFLYPVHFSIMMIKEEKEEKLFAVLKYYFLMAIVLLLEILVYKVTSSDFIKLLFLFTYFLLIKSDFDFSVLIFNILFLNKKDDVLKIGSFLKDSQNKLNSLLT